MSYCDLYSRLPPSVLQLPCSALLHDDLSAAQALELARRDGRAVAHSPQAAAMQLYAVINAQTDVVKSQVVLSIVHTCISHSYLHRSFTAASVIHTCISHYRLHQSITAAPVIHSCISHYHCISQSSCIRPALMTRIVDNERPGGKVDTASTYLEHAPVTVTDTCAHWQGS